MRPFHLRMMLINSLLSHATDARWEDLISELERLNVRKAVVVCSLILGILSIPRTHCPSCLQRLMSSNTIEDVTSSILDFQANIVRVTFRRKTTVVDPEQDSSQEATLQFIYTSSKLPEVVEEGEVYRWRRLGFETEDIRKEFAEVGVLGLDCLVSDICSVRRRLSDHVSVPEKSRLERPRLFCQGMR